MNNRRFQWICQRIEMGRVVEDEVGYAGSQSEAISACGQYSYDGWRTRVFDMEQKQGDRFLCVYESELEN